MSCTGGDLLRSRRILRHHLQPLVQPGPKGQESSPWEIVKTRDPTPRDFTLLGNCQAICFCLPYDGAQSLEPRRVYLKPHYLPLDHSYWRAKEAGQI